MTTLERKIEEVTSQFIADQMQKLADAERRADRLEQELIKAQSKNERVKLKAPIAGTVQQLAVTTIGQVVTTGQPLLTIVPLDSPIEIEVMIENKDIGFVEPGQPAVVKVKSFPFTRYGTIDGNRAQGLARRRGRARGQRAQRPWLCGQAAGLNHRDRTRRGHKTSCFPPSSASAGGSSMSTARTSPCRRAWRSCVEIRTGQRRAIDYVLSPLREVVSSTGHER